MSSLLPVTPIPDLSEPLWFAGPETPRLPGDEVHIWRAQLLTPGLDDREGVFPCPVSRDRSERIQVALFRNDILRRYATQGIPFPNSGVKIAVAQCEHVALIAVSREVRKIGLDMERVLDDIPIEEIASGFLDAETQWDLRITWSKREKAWKFFKFWTSNEACDQALTYTADCEVRGFTPEPDFIAALALEGGPEAEVVYWDWACERL